MRSVLARFLNVGSNLATLHTSGKVDSFIDKFIIFLKERPNTSAPSLRNFAVIWSGFTGFEAKQNLFTGIEAKQNLFNNLFRYV